LRFSSKKNASVAALEADAMAVALKLALTAIFSSVPPPPPFGCNTAIITQACGV
jgi:hypothetical protein